MSSMSKTILIGRLGSDPEVRYIGNGTAVANFSVATSEKWKDKNGERQEKTEWHRIVAWGKLAEICGEYLKKGALVYLEGQNETQQYEKDGVTHYTTKVICHEMKMLGGKDDGQRGGGGQGHSGGQGGRDANNGRQQQRSGNQQGGRPQQGGFEDDDIPF